MTAAEFSFSVIAGPLPPPVVTWLDWAFDTADWDLPALDVALPVLDVARPVLASEGLVVALGLPPPAGAPPLPVPLLVVPGVGHGLPPVGLEEFVGGAVLPPADRGEAGLALACGSDGLAPAATLLAAVVEVVLAGPAPVAGCAVLPDELDAVDGAAPTGGVAALASSLVGWLAVAADPVPDGARGLLASVFDAVCGALPGVLEGELLTTAAGTALEVFEPLALADSPESGAAPGGLAAACAFCPFGVSVC